MHDFIFNHTMLRIKDPAKSLPFYQKVLGMTLLNHDKYDDFDLYFLAFGGGDKNAREGVLELTHNHGTENDDTVYHNGNTEPRGFGHICIAVPDLDEAVRHFDAHGVQFAKRPEDGKMRNIAFIKDPDGYWIEIVVRR